MTPALHVDKGFVPLGCGADGRPQGLNLKLPEALLSACDATADPYRKYGFTPPWISYIALREETPVGGGAFVGPTAKNRVEIAYFTLPDFEGQGCAARTARGLVLEARRARPGVEVFAKTLPQMNASTTILSRLGFRHSGVVHDEDIGPAWAWLLTNNGPAG